MWRFIRSGSSLDADIFPFFQCSVSLASAPGAGSDRLYDCCIRTTSGLAIPRLVPVPVVRRHFQTFLVLYHSLAPERALSNLSRFN